MTDHAVRPEKIGEVRARLMAARDLLQEAMHELDHAGILDDLDRLPLSQLGADLFQASAKMEAARIAVTDLRLCLVTSKWSASDV